MRPTAPTVTVTFAPDLAFAAGTRTGTTADRLEDEVRRLLRSRLLLFQLLTVASATLLLIMAALTAEDSQIRRDRVPQAVGVTIALALLGTAALLRWPELSLRALRGWELLQFGTQAVINGTFRFTVLALATPEMTGIEVAFRGVVSLFGTMTIILAYGVLIPNTRRRSLLVVLGLTAVPFVALGAAAAVNPALRWGHLPALVFQAAANLLIPAAIAVFAASRADALQRRALAAERRADELGQYALKGRLGAGGMGEVWLAEHRLLKRPCAVKFVRADLAANPANAARFEREVRAVTALTHFNTVRVYDYGRSDDGSFYYVMEYLDGPTLEALVKHAGPLPPGRAVRLLRQLCGALSEAHAAGLVHRDLKPGNVIVATLGGQPDVAKLLDFGLVQDLSTVDDEGRLTQAGVVMGTPAYMCPEQAAGTGRVDARGDLYALGAVGFFCLTGRPPFVRDTVGGYIAAHLTEPAPAVNAVNPAVPLDLAAVVARCLAKNPAARFQSASELDAALAGCGCAAEGPRPRASTVPNASVGGAPTETFQ